MIRQLAVFIVFIFVIGCNNNEEFISDNTFQNDKNNSPQSSIQNEEQTEVIKINVRNVSYPVNDPGGSNLSKYYELRERPINIPINQTALILIDTWEIERKRFAKSDVLDIAKDIKPILNIARELDMLVLYSPHRPIKWDGINHKARNIDLRGPTDTPRLEVPEWIKRKKISPSQWPPVKFIFRVGDYSQYSRYSNPLYIPYPKILGIHKDLLPKKRKREFISSSMSDIKKIFKKNKILHLLYVGNATNQCVVQRPVGIRNMSALGYNTIIVRGATVGSELHSTKGSLSVTKSAILDIEINNGFSVSKEHLLNTLHSIQNE